MTDYADLKVDPTLRDVLEDVAVEQYGQEYRAISHAGHEAVIAALVLRFDDDIVDDVLDDHGFDSVSDLVDYLADGRFDTDDQFDPLAAVRTPSDGGDV